MNYKSVISIAVICSLGLVGCSPETENDQTTSQSDKVSVKTAQTPQQVVKGFLDAYLIKREIGKAYQYFSDADKKIKSEAQYITEKTQLNMEDILKKVNKYEIKSSEIGSNKSTFIVDITTLDIVKLIQEAMGDKSLFALGAMSQEESAKLAEKNLAKYKDGKTPPPTITEPQTIELIQENGEWRINIGWADAEQNKKVQNPVLKIGEQGTLMSDPAKGNVVLKVNSVKFNVGKVVSPGMTRCVVNVTVTNQMKEQFTEKIGIPLAVAEVFAQGGNKYKADFVFEPDLIKSIDITSPLNPGKSVTGDLTFEVDKTAKDLTLTLDAGHSPIPNNYEHVEDKSLSFKLGDVSL